MTMSLVTNESSDKNKKEIGSNGSTLDKPNEGMSAAPGNLSDNYLMVSAPTDAIGLLIGKSGKTLTKISMESGVHIGLQSHNDIECGSRERAVIIQGTISSTMKALRIIVPIIAGRKTVDGGNDRSVESASLGNDASESNDPDKSRGHDSALTETLGYAEETNSNFDLIKWVIPQSLCGKLIGKGGNGIKHINTSSGAWVKIAHIEEISPGENERYDSLTQ